ncbi:hypothetical protein CY34DRAFT_27200 [Suillus luteus UH-Slu-Lm8-n1]|uniref:Uncharacterized protein n=1 Tax=Suillus luteus UH-Slu-Lm8-n1 TaxID=930992 RepID=A0A0C9Z574_9AGAM|nr:hypothetical protein CY34DRAFT_27200 [Suillus luteus UH-Slu-Lm8-n1]
MPNQNKLSRKLTKFVKIRIGMGLLHTRQQSHTIESIRDTMMSLRETYPNAGAQEMVSLLFHERAMSVSRNIVIAYFANYEADLVHQCKACRLQRKRFWAAGVNDLFAVDQHNKWLRFGLALHTGIEPFSGCIMWNPQLILTYYLETIEELGHMPMVTQSDPGSENFGITNSHTMLRQWHDPMLEGTLQHRWMHMKKNVMPEITWSQLRHRFTPGFETYLDHGVESGWYDCDNTLQRCMDHFLHSILDGYKDRINNTMKRRDRNKVLPHGVPNLIYNSADNFGALDFKIILQPGAIDHILSTYIEFGHFVQGCYDELGHPLVNCQSAWTVYLDLHHVISQLYEQLPPMVLTDKDDDSLLLLENHKDLPFHEDDGAYYMGGVGGGLDLDESHLRQLDALIQEDEPSLAEDNLEGLNHAGLVVWEFFG